jgi:hypothetical protein
MIAGVQGRDGCRFVILEPHLPKVLAPVDRRSRMRVSSWNAPTAGPGIAPGGAEKGESPLPLL